MNGDPPILAMKRFDDIAMALEQSQPTLPYNENLAESLSALATELGSPITISVTGPFGNSPGTWKAYGDTIVGLEKLSKRYKLIDLSNIDNNHIRSTVETQLAPIGFDGTYTAQIAGRINPTSRVSITCSPTRSRNWALIGRRVICCMLRAESGGGPCARGGIGLEMCMDLEGWG
ncbi:hypothetical protein BJ170DRAFT_412903 [Xylariales sp. AK1849]|nr:hypothetical protein BJ170DRAFT_412903 [Xylariales sp. AK1849]